MFSIKQVFTVLFRFSECLATIFLSLNDELCMVGSTIIDLNPVELKYYHSWLVYINAVEVAMSYYRKFVFWKKQKT